jgi:hypothetical protein
MKLFPRKVSSGGRYLVPHRNGGFVSHKHLKKEGLGVSEKMYDRDTNKRHPLKSLAEDREFLSVKPPKSKKYISLNL